MSSSRHPIALRLEQRVGGATKLLATVMFLPLVDGIFPALVLAGSLQSPVGILQVGLLVFGGSATVAVIVAEMDSDPWKQAASVLVVGLPLIVLAAAEAALAPTFGNLIDIAVFERFAAVVIVAVAAKTASATIGEYLPRPSIIIGLGVIASLDITSISVAFTTELGLIARAAASGAVGVGFALAIVALRPWMEGVIDIDRFRFGSAVALGTLALSIVDLVPGEAPLAVLAVAALLSFDPGKQSTRTASLIDGSESQDDTESVPDGRVGEPVESERKRGYPGDGAVDERVPWL